MRVRSDDKRTAYVKKLEAEFGELNSLGLVSSGNASSSLMVIKGELSAQEQAGAELLSGEDGRALRSAFERLGYAPEDLVAISAKKADGSLIDADLLRQTVATLSPTTIVLCDNVASYVMCGAYARELDTIEQDKRKLEPGKLAILLGIRVLNLGGFEASLSDEASKQRSWHYLKMLPQLGQPY